MRSLAEHLHLVVSRVRPLEPLALPLLDANECVVAVDVTAPVDMPGYHSASRPATQRGPAISPWPRPPQCYPCASSRPVPPCRRVR